MLDQREQAPLAPPAPVVDEDVRAWALWQADLMDARLDQLTDQIERGEQAWAGCAGASGRVGARALSLVGVASEWR